MGIANLIYEVQQVKFTWYNFVLVIFCIISPIILKKLKNTMMVIFILFYAIVGYVSTDVQYSYLNYNINGYIAN